MLSHWTGNLIDKLSHSDWINKNLEPNRFLVRTQHPIALDRLFNCEVITHKQKP